MSGENNHENSNDEEIVPDGEYYYYYDNDDGDQQGHDDEDHNENIDDHESSDDKPMFQPDMGAEDYGDMYDMQNINYIFNTKAKFVTEENDYDYGQFIADGNLTKNVKSQRIPLDVKMQKSKSKTMCKLKNAKQFFDKRQKNHKIIINEHKKMQIIGVKTPHNIGSHSLNDLKNRYSAAVPFDFNRVKLLDLLYTADSDYINASYINNFERKSAYIATQNPLEHTVKEFWAMCYENKSKYIFCLVDYNNKKSPMERYWPPEGTVLEYNEFEIHAINKSKLGNMIIRDFEIVPTNGQKPLKVRHFNYTEWSDMRAPPNMSEISLLVKNAREGISDDNHGPIVVHCSSGTGRTGVFIALTMLKDQVEQFKVADVFRTCSFLREQRPLFFKDLPQYLFINIFSAKLFSLETESSNESLYTL